MMVSFLVVTVSLGLMTGLAPASASQARDWLYLAILRCAAPYVISSALAAILTSGVVSLLGRRWAPLRAIGGSSIAVVLGAAFMAIAITQTFLLVPILVLCDGLAVVAVAQEPSFFFMFLSAAAASDSLFGIWVQYSPMVIRLIPPRLNAAMVISIRRRSSRCILGLPLYDIAVGPSIDRREEYGRACGVVAVGNVACGILAVGNCACGVVAVGRRLAVGLASAGLFTSFGVVAIGQLLAVGGVALGIVGVGYTAAGLLAVGCISYGVWPWGMYRSCWLLRS